MLASEDVHISCAHEAVISHHPSLLPWWPLIYLSDSMDLPFLEISLKQNHQSVALCLASFTEYNAYHVLRSTFVFCLESSKGQWGDW
jgi:hypothetical protein